MRRLYNIDSGNTLITLNLDTLLKSDVTVEEYRDSFYKLGQSLGHVLNNKIDSYGNTMLSCSSEDADWLAQGVLSTIKTKKTSLSVFWHDRVKVDESFNIEYSPIVKSYVEPIDNCNTLIIVKSIISTSCVVKTQITRLINELNPQQVYILAPVMLNTAEENLKKEFPKEISCRFKFITFAVDDKVENGCIIPGIGGMVYPKLGLGDIKAKNKYIPKIIIERIRV